MPGAVGEVAWWTALSSKIEARSDPTRPSSEVLAAAWVERRVSEALAPVLAVIDGASVVHVELVERRAVHVPFHLALGDAQLYVWLPTARPPVTRQPRAGTRVVGLFASPHDRPGLRSRADRFGIQDALAASDLTHLLLEYPPTLEALAAVIEAYDDIAVVHISAHGERGHLALEDREGRAHFVTANDVARVLAPTVGSLRLVILASCESASASAIRYEGLASDAGARGGWRRTSPEAAPTRAVSSGQAGPAVALCEALGVPVLGMRHRVTDAYARQMAADLHRLLASGTSVTEAVAAVTRSPAGATTSSLDALAPVLLQPGDASSALAIPLRSPAPEAQPLTPPRRLLEGRHGDVNRTLRAIVESGGAVLWGPPGVGTSALAEEVADAWASGALDLHGDRRAHRLGDRADLDEVTRLTSSEPSADHLVVVDLPSDDIVAVEPQLRSLFDSAHLLVAALRPDPLALPLPALAVRTLDPGPARVLAYNLPGLSSLARGSYAQFDDILEASAGHPGLLHSWEASLTSTWMGDGAPTAVTDQFDSVQAWTEERLDLLDETDRYLALAIASLAPQDRVPGVLEQILELADDDSASRAPARHRPSLRFIGERPHALPAVGEGTATLTVDALASLALADQAAGISARVLTAGAKYWAPALAPSREHSTDVLDAGWRRLYYVKALRQWDAVSQAVEWILGRDRRPDTAAELFPTLLKLVDQAEGTPREPIEQGLLATAEARFDPTAAEQRFVAMIHMATSTGDWRRASSLTARLALILQRQGRSDEALEWAGRKADFTQRAGLGPWSVLADKGMALDMATKLNGHQDRILRELPTLVTEADHLPDDTGRPENAHPHQIRRSLRGVGFQAAQAAGNWLLALRYARERIDIKRSHGAPASELALSLFDVVESLIELGHPRLAERALHLSGKAFAADGYGAMIGQGAALTARLDRLHGDHLAAYRALERALEHAYEDIGHTEGVAAAHDEMASLLADSRAADALRSAGVTHIGRLAVAHHLASALLTHLARHPRAVTPTQMAQELVEMHNGPSQLPVTVNELGDAAGWPLPQVVALGHRTDAADEWLASVAARTSTVILERPGSG